VATPVTGRTRDFVIALDRGIHILTKHWLFAVNWALTIYIALPLLAPWMAAQGHDRLADFVYRAYGPPACHQLPERSYFFYGPQYDYTLAELETAVGHEVPLRYQGGPEVGYKVGMCQRCVAIYVALLFGGIAYGVVRDRLKPLSWKVLVAFLLPMAIDGGGQLIGLWESTWVTRTITGISAGMGMVLFVYPFIEEGMRDVQKSVLERLESADGPRSGAARRKGEEPEPKEGQDNQSQELVEAR
jgi:uncharacterized membrane protein